jgi:hypothetical protein
MTEQMLCTFERKILRRICGPIQNKDAGVLDGIVKFIFLEGFKYRERYQN